MSSELFEETVRIAARFASEVEPRPWGPAGHALELAKQVGALSECVLIREGYKQGRVGIGKIEDETSDVLFMLFRIGHLLGVSLDLPGVLPQNPPRVEELMLALIRGTGEVVSLCTHVSDDGGQDRTGETLGALVLSVAHVAAYYGFPLEEAHRTELKRAESWLQARGRPSFRRLHPILRRLTVPLRPRARRPVDQPASKKGE